MLSLVRILVDCISKRSYEFRPLRIRSKHACDFEYLGSPLNYGLGLFGSDLKAFKLHVICILAYQPIYSRPRWRTETRDRFRRCVPSTCLSQSVCEFFNATQGSVHIG